MLRGAKYRTNKHGLPACNLTLDDIKIPPRCPVFNTEFKLGTDKAPLPESPSLDRIIPSLGYVKGNVRVISYRANFLKKDGTLNDFKLLVSYLEGTT